MKILYVITGADIGGAQKHLIHLVEWFKGNGNIVHVVTGEEGPLVNWLENIGVNVTVIPIPRKIQLKEDWFAFRRLRKFISQNQYDIVHCHSSKAGIIGRLAAFVNRVPKIVFTAHGFVYTDPTLSSKKRNFYILIERIFGSISTDIITVSQFDYEAGLKIGLLSNRLHKIHNGIPKTDVLSISEWKKKQEKLRIQNKKIIGFVGRLVSEKNIDMLIRVASLLKQNNNLNYEFWIIGDGALEDKYRKMVIDQDLTEQVQFLGNQSNVLGLMDQMHSMVITSHKEGLPYVLLEAMGRGLPVVSTDVGGVKEVLDPKGTHGLIVPINDDQEMYEKLQELLINDEHRETLGRYLLQQANDCTVDVMCEKTANVIGASEYKKPSPLVKKSSQLSS